jgi:hypothetical protein
MRYVVLILVLAWAAIMPPFFTHGACDAQFEEEMATVKASRSELLSPDLANRYWNSRAVPFSTYSSEQCRHSGLRFVDGCGPGPLIYATVPVKNGICRFYRDASVTVQLVYNSEGQLVRIQTDMAPFKQFDLPFLSKPIYWAK